MKFNVFAILFLCGTLGTAQDFYDLNTIQTIEITFAQSNWDALMDAQKAGAEDYIMAQSVSINGLVMDSVGVKYKGNSTYNPNQTKNPLHIELDTYKEHDYQGFKDIKLSNVAKDPSFLREVLSYQILRQYMDAPESNYANVYINGDLMGLYSNSEAISKTFVDAHFGSKNNTFIKCNPPAGAGPQSNDFPNLVYLGQDSSDYYDAYEMKSDAGWQELIDFCDTLANETAAVEQILDVDRALWMLAFDNLLVNLDSYIGAFAQNYYLYRDDYGRFIPVVWDLNESFGRFSMTGAGNLNSNTAKQQMSHLLGANDADFPLVSKLFANPMYKRMYLAHVKTMLKENFENDAYFTTGQSLQDLIATSVQADGNKFFTYANFQNNLTSDIGGGGGGPGGGGSTIGIANLMDARTDYLLGLSDFSATEPTISNVTQSNTTPIINETLTITAEVDDATTVLLGFKTKNRAPFERVELYDDGAHNDGAAGDGIYGVDIQITDAFTRYYIYAENATIGKFSPQRAEYEYHTITATVTNPTVGDLVINEIMASNSTTVADQDGEFDDWIELYNNTSSAIDLEGYMLSDNDTELDKWVFPAGTSIAANGYITVWADKDETQAGFHADFKLSAAGESVFLTSPSGDIEDEVTYLDLPTDISYGRFANGTGAFQLMNATFGAENDGTSSAVTVDSSVDFEFYPNPAEHTFFLDIKTEQEVPVSIFNTQGALMLNNTIQSSTWIDVADWNAGVYIIQIGAAYRKLIIL